MVFDAPCFENKSLSINEYSIVKAELLAPSAIEKGSFSSLGDRWIVFSNIYLSNSRSFPNLDITIKDINDWEDKYFDLLERQKKITPKFKKDLDISEEDKVEFYYPYTNMYYSLKGKRKGDIVLVNNCVPYRVKEVYTPVTLG